MKPDWRVPNANEVTADWKEMQVPGNWEARGLPDFDGVVWFTRTIDVPAGTGDASLSLGAIRTTSEVWVNGIQVTQPGGGGTNGNSPVGNSGGTDMTGVAAVAGACPPRASASPARIAIH